MRTVVSLAVSFTASLTALAIPLANVAHAANPLLTNVPAPAPAPVATAPASETPAAPGSTAPAMLERVRRGVVLLERDGRLLGFGTVLAGDGRILTSLSAVAGNDAVDVHYADGATVHARVGHRDAAWDLALLVPRTIHWKDGLAASQLDPSATDLRAPIPPRIGARPIALPVHFKGRTDAISRQGESLLDALDVEVHNTLPIAGAPILDQEATVVGVLVHACKLALDAHVDTAKTRPIGCAPTLIGAPASALLSFLSRTPADAVAPTPWLGIAGEPDASGSVHGVRVMAVAPQSPAQRAGLKAASGDAGADRIIAVDGAPVETPEKLSEAIAKHAIGETVKLLVLGGRNANDAAESNAQFRDVAVVLRSAP